MTRACACAGVCKVNCQIILLGMISFETERYKTLYLFGVFPLLQKNFVNEIIILQESFRNFIRKAARFSSCSFKKKTSLLRIQLYYGKYIHNLSICLFKTPTVQTHCNHTLLCYSQAIYNFYHLVYHDNSSRVKILV